jgi:hypothetical protein
MPGVDTVSPDEGIVKFLITIIDFILSICCVVGEKSWFGPLRGVGAFVG